MENLIYKFFFLILTKETPIKRIPQYPILVIFKHKKSLTLGLIKLMDFLQKKTSQNYETPLFCIKS